MSASNGKPNPLRHGLRRPAQRLRCRGDCGQPRLSRTRPAASVAAGIAGHECASGFPAVAQYTEALPFRLFAGAMMVQAAVLWRYFPETRGVALETMEGTVEGRK